MSLRVRQVWLPVNRDGVEAAAAARLQAEGVCKHLSCGPSTLPAKSVRWTGCALRKPVCSSDPAACCQGHLAVGGRDAG